MENKKKRVAFLCQYFYPEDVSSATLPYDLAKHLANSGFDIFCLCGYPKEYLKQNEKIKKEETINGIRIKRLKYLTPSKKTFIGRIINFFSFSFKCLAHKRYFKDYDYLVVYSNPPILPYVAYRIQKKYGTKIIFVSYDVYPEIAIRTSSISEKGFIADVMNTINKKLFASVYKVVALSQDMKNFLSSSRELKKEKIEVISNWFDHEKFVTAKNANVERPKHVFTISYFGNLGTCQDIETILNAAVVLKGDNTIRFIVCGRGNKYKIAKDYIESSKLKNVNLIPFLNGEAYIDMMNTSDCFLISLVPGITDLCYPSKYYSYLAVGRPIIPIMEECELAKEINEVSLINRVKNGDSLSLVNEIKRIQKLNVQDYLILCNRMSELYRKNYCKERQMEKYKNLVD